MTRPRLNFPSVRSVDPHLLPGDLVIMPVLCPAWRSCTSQEVDGFSPLMEQRLCIVIGLAPVETRGPDTAGSVALFFCPSADLNEDRLFWAEVLYVERVISRA